MAVKFDTISSGDQSWLASDHGMFNARTSTLPAGALTATAAGVIKSGTPVNAANEGALAAWTGAEGEKLGFILTDQAAPAAGSSIAVPVLRHGLVKVHRLPVDFEVPAAGAESFTFITEENA